jgi:hypothetical protein
MVKGGYLVGRLWLPRCPLRRLINNTTSSFATMAAGRTVTDAATNIRQLVGTQISTNTLDTLIDHSMIPSWFAPILLATGVPRLAWIPETCYACALYRLKIDSSRFMVPLHTSTTLRSVHIVVSRSPMTINYNQPYLPICAGSCQIKRISHFHPFMPRLKNLHIWYSQYQDEQEERRLENPTYRAASSS